MQFSIMQQELSDRLGAYDSTISADATKLKRWLNMAQQDITNRFNWPFMLYHEIMQTSTDITTGTVSVSAGSTALTFSSAPAVSVAEYFIKFSTSNSWYQISSHTASSTAAVMTPAYGQSSNLAGGTYVLRKLFYATSTPLDSILDIKKTETGQILESANARDADVFLPLYWDSGEIYKYISSIPDATGGIRISFLYSPASVENIQVRGVKKLVDMSADSDVSIIPQRWHSAVLDMASFYGFSSIDDTRATDFFNKAGAEIDNMARVYLPDLGRHRVSRSLVEGVTDTAPYVLPPQYGAPES